MIYSFLSTMLTLLCIFFHFNEILKCNAQFHAAENEEKGHKVYDSMHKIYDDFHLFFRWILIGRSQRITPFLWFLSSAFFPLAGRLHYWCFMLCFFIHFLASSLVIAHAEQWPLRMSFRFVSGKTKNCLRVKIIRLI